jgi:hypothetical protein
MTDWDITIVPVIDPLDLTVLSGSTRSPAPGQTVTKGIICHERVKYFILITNLLLLGRFVGLRPKCWNFQPC